MILNFKLNTKKDNDFFEVNDCTSTSVSLTLGNVL